jgi:hypothetical protein
LKVKNHRLLLEFVDDRAGLVFLDETNDSVEQEQTADNTEIDPMLETGSHCKRKWSAKVFPHDQWINWLEQLQ